MLFFQTVEKTDDQKAQADALSVIFTLAKENITYAKELDGLLANKMILKVLLTPNCVSGYHFAKVDTTTTYYVCCVVIPLNYNTNWSGSRVENKFKNLKYFPSTSMPSV